MNNKNIFRIILYVLVFVVVLWSLLPIFILFKVSLTPINEIFSYPPKLFGSVTLKNYADLIKDWGKFFVGLKNSIIIMFGAVFLTLFVSIPTSYAFSRYSRTKAIKRSSTFLIIARMFPPIIITIPLFPVLNSLKLIDNHLTLIILYAAFYVSIGTLTLKSYFDNIPIELEESALIEGCSRVKSFIRILLPLVFTGIVSVSILVAIFSWKEFLFSFLFTTQNAVTAPVVLNEMLGGMFGVSWGPLFAAACLHLLPILILIGFSQKFIINAELLSTDK